jgi:hypothetical protein
LVVNVTSIPKRLQRIDLSEARDVLKFTPQDTYPQGMAPTE